MVKNPWFKEIPWKRTWWPTLVFLSGKCYRQRSLVGYSPWGHKRVGNNLETKQQILTGLSSRWHLLCNRKHIWVKGSQIYLMPSQSWMASAVEDLIVVCRCRICSQFSQSPVSTSCWFDSLAFCRWDSNSLSLYCVLEPWPRLSCSILDHEISTPLAFSLVFTPCRNQGRPRSAI